MPNTMQLGRLGKTFAAEESSFGTAPTLAATDAYRHLAVKFPWNPRNRVNSPERLSHPSLVTRFTRKASAQWSTGGIFFPSGTLNTAPDHEPFLKHGFGAVDNTTLATTVSASPSPTATGATVASATGLAVGKAVLISIAAGASAGKYVRVLTAVASNALTWAPALPAAPASGDSVKACITYSLASALPNSLTIAHYLPSVNYEVNGAVVDMLKFTIDANDEIRWEASGPAQKRIRPAQAQPGAFTVVGTTPPSGLTGSLRVGSAAYEMVKFELTITNGMALDNFAAGLSQAQAFFRQSRRQVAVAVNAMYSSDVTLLAAGEGTTDQVLLAQCGQTEGSIVALYCPAVEFDVPDDPDADETAELASVGVAKGVSGNDEVVLAVA